MNRRVLGLAVLGLALGSSVAVARNFHCAGGIQYVIQGTKEKDKGNLDDAHRIFGKAVAQLTECVKEDPNDSESWSYLGWAYCEVDSPAEAHDAFTEGRKRLAAEPKKIDILNNNWKVYWIGYYNQGLARYNEAKGFVPAIEGLPNATGATADSARAKLALAEISFAKAIALLPDSVRAFNNLSIVQGLQGKFADAANTVERGLIVDPNNQDLKDRKDSMVGNAVVERVKAGDYDGALKLLDGLLAKHPDDYGNLVLAAQTSYEQGDKIKDKDAAGAKAAYLRAAGYYGHAFENATLPADKHDMRFNQAVALQNAGDNLGEAKIIFAMVQDSPKDKSLQGMLRSAYDRIGSKKKTDDQVWVILGLNDTATPVPDVAGYVSKVVKASDAGKTLAAQGPPEEIKQFKTDQSMIDIWYYWTKKLVFAFSTGRQVGSANFGEFGPETVGAAATPSGGAGSGAAAGTAPAKAPAPKPAPKAPVKKG